MVLSLSAFVSGTAATAQMDQRRAPTPTTTGQSTTVWHVVRKGETFESITALYLGTSERWQENHRLNPDIVDPHMIQPGQRLRVLFGSDLPAQAAIVIQLANRVESLLNPRPWQGSILREVLRNSDAVRTFENASAELRLRERGSLLVTEESIVYLRTSGPRVEQRQPAQIEIEVGQADYEAATPASGATTANAGQGVEIVLGAARAKPKADADGNLFTRARVDDSKQSQLMVYGGSSSLSTPSGAVALETGTGTSVAANGKAAPPERLLTAPTLTTPEAEARVLIADANFAWRALDGAESYVVELCTDPRCATLMRRTEGVEGTTFEAPSLPEGRVFWRVTARSASGLDGYPSGVRMANLTQTPPVPPDTEAPWARIRFLGPQVTIPERFLVGPGAEILIESGDIGTAGVESIRSKIDGKAVAASALAGPWSNGDHTLDVVVLDGAENRFEHKQVPFAYDAVPPILRWGHRPGSMIGETQGTEDQPAISIDGSTSTDRRLRFEWAPGAERSWRSFVGHVGVPQEAPTIGIRPARGAYRLAGSDLVISRKQPLWLTAEDALCRAVHLSALVIRSADGSVNLIVDAVDLLGNATRQVWPLAETKAKGARR